MTINIKIRIGEYATTFFTINLFTLSTILHIKVCCNFIEAVFIIILIILKKNDNTNPCKTMSEESSLILSEGTHIITNG